MAIKVGVIPTSYCLEFQLLETVAAYDSKLTRPFHYKSIDLTNMTPRAVWIRTVYNISRIFSYLQVLLETDLKVHMVLLELSLFQTPQNLFRGILPAVTGDAQENVSGPPTRRGLCSHTPGPPLGTHPEFGPPGSICAAFWGARGVKKKTFLNIEVRRLRRQSIAKKFNKT